jgi:hypothetical protein
VKVDLEILNFHWTERQVTEFCDHDHYDNEASDSM